MSIRLIFFTYLLLVVLLLLFTAFAVAVIGVEARFLIRFVPLSGTQFAVFTLLSTAIVAFSAIRLGMGLREYIVTLLASPLLGAGLLALAWGLQRILPGLDFWVAALLTWGMAAAITLGFSDRILDFGLPLVEELEEWEEEGEWEEEEEEYEPPPPVRVRRLPRTGPPIRTQRMTTDEEEAEDPWANVKRNDPCPCGSGKKYKNCHGRAKKQKR